MKNNHAFSFLMFFLLLSVPVSLQANRDSLKNDSVAAIRVVLDSIAEDTLANVHTIYQSVFFNILVATAGSDLGDTTVVEVNEQSVMATTTPASPILWLLGGLVPGLIIGTLLTWLYLNSRKRKTSPESGSDPLSDEKLDEPKEEVEETAEADPMLSQHSSQPVLLPVTPVPVANKYAAFVDDYEQAGKLFQQSLLLMNGEAKIVQVLKKVVIGTGAEGLLGHAAAWRKKQEAGPLNLDDVLTELAGRETAANLAWLARLHLVTKIDAVKDYFEDQGVNLPALHNYSNTIFDLLNRDLGLEFVCPQPGEHFDEVKYDLVMSNIGALSGLDGGALKRVLQNWQPPTNRPIYDVGELALSQQGTYESKLLPNFPSRTTVAYYSKH